MISVPCMVRGFLGSGNGPEKFHKHRNSVTLRKRINNTPISPRHPCAKHRSLHRYHTEQCNIVVNWTICFNNCTTALAKIAIATGIYLYFANFPFLLNRTHAPLRQINWSGCVLPPRAISLLSRLREMSTGTLGLVSTVAVSPLAGMKQLMPAIDRTKGSMKQQKGTETGK